MAMEDSKRQKVGSDKGVVIIVDFSANPHASLGDECVKRGYSLIDIDSHDDQKKVRFLPEDKAAESPCLAHITHSGKLDAQSLKPTLEQIRAACGESCIVACLNNSDNGGPLHEVLAEAFGVSANSPATFDRRRDKWTMMEAVRDAGLRATSESKVVDLAGAEAALADKFSPFPKVVVVKPTNAWASDGVTFCNSEDDVLRAVESLLGKDNSAGNINKELLIQEFLEGPEYELNVVSWDGVHKITEVSIYDQRPLPGHPSASHGLKMVTGNAPGVEEVVEYYLKVLYALDVKFGPTNGEIKLTPNGPCLVEMNYRCQGGSKMMQPLHQAAHGYSQVSAYLDAAQDLQSFIALPSGCSVH